MCCISCVDTLGNSLVTARIKTTSGSHPFCSQSALIIWKRTPVGPNFPGVPPFRIHRSSGVFGDVFECLSVFLMIRSDVKGGSDSVVDDDAAAVPLDCHGVAAARAVFCLNRSFLFLSVCFFRLLISIIDDGGVSAVIVV